MNIKRFSAAPVNGSSEVQTITIGGTVTGGTFNANVNGSTTKPITWSATNATLLANIQAAIDAVIGTSNTLVAALSLTAGIGTITVTFQNTYANQLQSAITCVNNLTGTAPTVACVQTTPGVTATFRDSPAGQLVVDTSTANLWKNTSTTLLAPTWNPLTLSSLIVVSAASGALAIPATSGANFLITYNGGAGAYTLAAPSATLDNGKKIVIVTASAQAHVITSGVDGFNAKGSSGTATYTAAKGNALELVAYNGHWYNVAVTGVTIA